MMSQKARVATRQDLFGPFIKCNMAVLTEFGDLGLVSQKTR